MSYFLFFIAGLCSLVYEVVWSRMLVLVMGNTTLAAAGVLASFMAGLALGSYFWGRYSDRHPEKTLSVFGILRMVIGCYGFASPWLFSLMVPLDAWLSDQASMSLWPRLIISLAVLMVPTFCMGGSLALLGRRFIKQPEQFGRDSALYYGLDGVGSMIGALATGFVLIQKFGHAGSLYLAGGVNLAVGAAVLVISSKYPWLQTAADKKASRKRRKSKAKQSKGRGLVFATLIGMGLSGFAAMGYQVFWTRLLIPVVDNSVYSFTLTLAFFLGGLSLGGIILAPLQKLIKKPAVFFALLQILIGAASFAFPFFIKVFRVDWSTPYYMFLLKKLPWYILVPSTIMGAVLPLAARVHQEWRGDTGRSLGAAFAYSAGGGVLGALAAGLYFIPSLGFYKTSMLLPTLNFMAGGLVLLFSVRPLLAGASLGMMAAFGLAGGFMMPVDYFFNKCAQMEPKSSLEYYHEGLAATAAVFKRPDLTTALYFNGMPEVDDSIPSLTAFKIMGALPGLTAENPRHSLMVCFGAGITSASAALYSERVSAVDVVAVTPRIAQFFVPVSGDIIHNPKFDLTIDDARHYLQGADDRFDIIISDSTHPRAYDSWILYTREFYELVRLRLTETGMFGQWVPFHGLPPDRFLAIIKTFSNVFPHTSVWNLGGSYAFLLAGPDKLEIDFREFIKRMSENGIGRDLRSVGLDDPFVLLSHFEMGEDGVRELIKGNDELLTDNSPSQLFFSPVATLNEQYRDWPEKNRLSLSSRRESIVPYLTNLGDGEEQRKAIVNRMVFRERTRNW